MGGCSFTAHALFGRPGNNPYCHYRARTLACPRLRGYNPYCHYRARTLAAEGKRERLVPTTAAEGKPFDNGLFDLVLESLDAPEPRAPRPPEELVRLSRRPSR